MPSDKIENITKRYDELYYETRENEMKILHKLATEIFETITTHDVKEMTIIDVSVLEQLSNVYKNIKG